MSKSYNQKLKILYLRDLLEETDPEHLLSMREIQEALGEKGIASERKSVYNDIGALEEYGLRIVHVPGRSGGYYLEERSFTLPEIKLLVDAVQASKFITEKKSRELIKKLEGLTGKKEAHLLDRQVVVSRTNKNANETVYENVDLIYGGIGENAQISFQYAEWTVDKVQRLRRGGKLYRVSPWFLNWDDENYYLIAYDDEADLIKHFRVDKMRKIRILEEKRLGRDRMEALDLGDYVRRTFGMFAGEPETVSLDCDTSLIGVLIDRFGTDISVRKMGEDRIRVRVPVALSPHFFGWVSGFGGRMIISSPTRVKEEYCRYMEDIIRKYNHK